MPDKVPADEGAGQGSSVDAVSDEVGQLVTSRTATRLTSSASFPKAGTLDGWAGW